VRKFCGLVACGDQPAELSHLPYEPRSGED
jgi:hypothetical protein